MDESLNNLTNTLEKLRVAANCLEHGNATTQIKFLVGSALDDIDKVRSVAGQLRTGIESDPATFEPFILPNKPLNNE